MGINGFENIELWAVVLGVTDSILDLEMPYGYELVRRRLDETPIYDELMSNNKNLNPEYKVSNLSNSDSPEFIFIHKTENKKAPFEWFTIRETISGFYKAKSYFNNIMEEWNKEIFRILSMLRLTQEGNIEVLHKYYKFDISCMCNNYILKAMCCQDNPIRVVDNLFEWNSDNCSVFKNIEETLDQLWGEMEDIIRRFNKGYTYSNFEDAYRNLVTLTEIILIGYNSNDKSGGKKSKFANRLAVSISNNENVRSNRDKALQIYKERSNEVHDGNSQNITKDELKELRCMVRGLVQNFISFAKSEYNNISNKSFSELKRRYVVNLISKIELLKSDGLLD